MLPYPCLSLQSLCSCGSLNSCLQCHPHTSLRLLSPAAYHPYARGVPSQHASNSTYHPYTCIMPTQHASNAAYHHYACSAGPTCLQCCLPSLRLQCPPNIPSMLLTILTLAVPSQDASNVPLTLARSSRLLMILTLMQPPQDETTMPPPISALTTPYASAPPPYLLCALKICLRRHAQPPLSLILFPPLTILMFRY
ncbi:hypothetical protein O181_100998 [Austropuccinia psidii MF-1]|uniref:Uncharacterized protein n=1 Tax=Austropuccinia psidii MF-1 TaxID=1389203 RepID=A0A9Q3JFP6_9BASI|nr:hypothetical protein [Austropuccinia psidii MF-1]